MKTGESLWKPFEKAMKLVRKLSEAQMITNTVVKKEQETNYSLAIITY